MALRWAMLLLFCASAVLASVPPTDACRQYGTSCDLCTDFVGCYWCGQADGSAQCVANFDTIRADCPKLVLTRSFCKTDGLSLTPPPSSMLQASMGNAAGLATMATLSVLVLVLFLLSCMTFMFCPNSCGKAPAWCCGGCAKQYRSC